MVKMMKKYNVVKTQHGFNDHVNDHGKTLKKDGIKFFGDVISLLNDCTDASDITKQQSAAKKLGQMNLNSMNYLELSPMAKQAVLNYIQATQQYNVDQSEILKAMGTGATAITKATQQTHLSNAEYRNKRVEGNVDFNGASVLETQRHKQEMAYIQLQARIRYAMSYVNGSHRLMVASVQPEIAQVKANLEHNKQVTKAYLSEGDNTTIDLIPRKNYEVVMEKSKNFLSAVSERLGLYL